MGTPLTPEQCRPVVNESVLGTISPALTQAAGLELSKSHNLVAYMQKLHLNALDELGNINVLGEASKDLAVRYAKISTRIAVLKSLLELPMLAEQHQQFEELQNDGQS